MTHPAVYFSFAPWKLTQQTIYFSGIMTEFWSSACTVVKICSSFNSELSFPWIKTSNPFVCSSPKIPSWMQTLNLTCFQTLFLASIIDKQSQNLGSKCANTSRYKAKLLWSVGGSSGGLQTCAALFKERVAHKNTTRVTCRVGQSGCRAPCTGASRQHWPLVEKFSQARRAGFQARRAVFNGANLWNCDPIFLVSMLWRHGVLFAVWKWKDLPRPYSLNMLFQILQRS